ncbi:hypothetical protein [Daejeonella sp. H1SJ63]|uniref:hypothetical protein n=1 Tax=Daejeonella sp. H1SJ63 TaxID=3034145 RepID=UPI0023ED2997|nr:hypothetical protein [Daejeonella sp. H1SJ63]
MTRNKIFVVHKSNGYKAFLSKIIIECSIDSWVFLGEDALIPYQLEISILNDIERYPLAEELGKSQYEHLEQYIDFIDDLESRSGEELWWASRLSWKNPWDSSFYLTYCQLDIYRKILLDDTFKNKNLLILVEDFALFECIKQNSNIDRPFSYYTAENYFDNITAILKSYSRRPYIFLCAAISKLMCRLIFKNTTFDTANLNQDNLIILPTFIDSRNFRSGVYSDPFIGKVFETESIKTNCAVIVPIDWVGTKHQLKLFNKWLENNGFKVFFLYNSLSLYNILLELSKFKNTSSSNKKISILNGLNITPLINKEKLRERRAFSLQNKLIKAFSKKVGAQVNNKLTIYPFENQAWERVFLYEMRKHNNIKSVGLQNAPCPALSTRFYFSKKLIDALPLPDTIIATGNVSFKNLETYYGLKTEILTSQSGRDFISGLSKNTLLKYSQVMVACSLGEKESVALITFVVNTLRNNKNFQVSIVPHPLANYDYVGLFKKLDCPAHISLKTSFADEMKKADVVLFDSSSAGLEALANGIQPIFIGSKNALHVNPNEFDAEITKYAYTEEQLMDALIYADMENPKEVIREYFGDGSTMPLTDILENIIKTTFSS